MSVPAEVVREAVPSVHNPGLPSAGAIASALAQVLDNPVAIEVLTERLQKLDAYWDKFMVPDLPAHKDKDSNWVDAKMNDYGVTPGTKTIALHLTGGQKLKGFFQVFDRPRISERSIEDWDRSLFHYLFETDLLSRFTGEIVATGTGSCNSREAKYRYRLAKRSCPNCDAEALIKGRPNRDGSIEWVCWEKKGGCNEKFPLNDERITGQQLGRVLNEDICDQVNTIMRMAKKRAFLDAIVQLVRACGRDVEAVDEDLEDDENTRGKGAKDTGAKDAGAAGPEKAADVVERVSEVEQAQLLKAATGAGHKAGDVARWLLLEHKVDLTKGRLPRAIYATALERVAKADPLVPTATESAQGTRA